MEPCRGETARLDVPRCTAHDDRTVENYQQQDGSVVIPEALRPFMDGQERIEPRG